MNEWYNSNTQRKYPISEAATCLDDAGNELPTTILADLVLLLPANMVATARVSGVVVSPHTCSVSFACALGTLAVATWLRSSGEYVTVPVVPLMPGVSGSVAFGEVPQVSSVQAYRFTTVEQSCLEVHAVHAIDPAPVNTIAPYGGDGSQQLHGLIFIEQGVNVLITSNGNEITISMDPVASTQLTSPCDRGAEQAACGRPPIRKINGVGPDANGVIHLEIIK